MAALSFPRPLSPRGAWSRLVVLTALGALGLALLVTPASEPPAHAVPAGGPPTATVPTTRPDDSSERSRIARSAGSLPGVEAAWLVAPATSGSHLRLVVIGAAGDDALALLCDLAPRIPVDVTVVPAGPADVAALVEQLATTSTRVA